jgi:hypothetical protein
MLPITLPSITPFCYSIVPYLVVSISAVFVFGWLTRRNTPNGLPLPPGPKPLPLIGNLLDIPKEKDWETYRAWNERYGDVVYVQALGSKIVVLSSDSVINELFERRSSTYSDRPSTVMLIELYSHLSLRIILVICSDSWTKQDAL